MSGSTFGTKFKITTWGESHGTGVGVVIDGCPAGLALCEADIQKYLDRRKPGQSRYSTPRREEDAVEIQSGIFEGRTTGTPISMVVYNKNQFRQTTVRLLLIIVRDMQITHLMQSTVFVITAAAGVPRHVRQSAV